jgi:hypothetical protein
LGFKKRTVTELINVMKETGAPAYCSKIRKSYCYKDDGHFNISFISVQ